jgi:3-oxoacyl-[acyl-carrier protein] reductase
MRLDDQVAVITGSAMGVGRGLALALAERGALIAGLDIDDDANAETGRQVEAAGSEFLALSCDISDKSAVRRAIDEVGKRFGRINVLVNNAAVFEDSRLLAGDFDTQTAEYERSMGTCAMGAYYCMAACLPFLLESEGNVVNIITEHIEPAHHLKNMPALGYDCAKFALWRQVASWADELRARNVRVNGLAFGATDTPMLRNAAGSEFAAKAMKPADIGQALINVLAHGAGGPSGEVWVFGVTRTPREESLVAIDAIGPGGVSA